MKKVRAVAIVFAFFLIIGVAFAAEGEKDSCCPKGTAALNCVAQCIQSLSKGLCWNKSGETKAPAPVLTDEELKIQRESVGMGMKGRTK
jgi:hypothetical protein